MTAAPLDLTWAIWTPLDDEAMSNMLYRHIQYSLEKLMNKKRFIFDIMQTVEKNNNMHFCNLILNVLKEKFPKTCFPDNR